MDTAFQWKVLTLFDDLVERDAAGREAALADAGDPALAEAVRALLKRDTEATHGLPTIPPALRDEDAAPLPERVGAWRLDAQIGIGGMGSVWRAERDDGLFEQTVAIKFILPAIMSGRAREYFDAERRILGRLRHPGIARILDAGTTENGHGWLAMELVEGLPITEALAGAPLEARLDAFAAAAEAVSHAHRSLVVHADIKPSNILVGEDGAVKLLDFGIARLLDAEDGSAGGIEPMTRSHAAPERLAGGGSTVSTDVYALGVVLYELLTGGLPASVGETRTRLDDEEASVVSIVWPHASEAVRPGGIEAGALRGDLDAIVARSLAADPAERYPDVAALLADLTNHRAARPVSPLAGDRGYRARRFLTRNRRAIAIGGALAALLIFATLFSAFAYLRAERERAIAEARFDQLRGLSRYILFDAIDSLQTVPGSAPVRAALAEQGQNYLEGLALDRDAPVELAFEAGEAQLRLASISGVVGMGGLGDPERARAQLDEAERILRGVVARDPRHAPALAELGWIELSRWSLAGQNEGTRHLVSAWRWIRQALAVDPAQQRAQLGTVVALRAASYDASWASDFARAERYARSGLALVERQSFSGVNLIDARIARAGLMMRLGDALYYQDRIPDALVEYRRGRDVVRAAIRRHGAMPRLLSTLSEAHWNIAGSLGDSEGGVRAAIAELDQGIPLLERVLSYGPDERAENLLIVLLGQKASYLLQLGQPREALATSQRALAMRIALVRRAPDDLLRQRSVAVQLHTQTDIQRALGDGRAACRSATQAMEMWSRFERAGAVSELDRADELEEMRALREEVCQGG